MLFWKEENLQRKPHQLRINMSHFVHGVSEEMYAVLSYAVLDVKLLCAYRIRISSSVFSLRLQCTWSA